MSITDKVVVKDPHGLHLRAAVGLILAVRKYKSRVTLRKGTVMANAQSLLGLLSLGASRGTELEVVSEGEDAPMALGEIRHYLNSPRNWD
jgi:phosphotransferase system HPr (HPr) family protein